MVSQDMMKLSNKTKYTDKIIFSNLHTIKIIIQYYF